MGSPCEVQLFAGRRREAQALARSAMADVAGLEARYSRYRSDSLLAAINRVAAQGGSVSVDAETASLLDYALTCYEQSDGLFDITSGPLREAWRFDSGRLPDGAVIEALLARIGWHFVQWNAPVLTFTRPGMALDFGGIVKEYAVDRAAALCVKEGAQSGYVNLGGDLKIIGPRPDGLPWRIGVKHPRQSNAILQVVELHAGAVASSGDYERCIEVDGQRYGHVLNPRTGWPVQHLAAVTVVGDFCVIAGSASTIAMLKEREGPAWLEAMALPHFWVDVHGTVGGTLLPKPL